MAGTVSKLPVRGVLIAVIWVLSGCIVLLRSQMQFTQSVMRAPSAQRVMVTAGRSTKPVATTKLRATATATAPLDYSTDSVESQAPSETESSTANSNKEYTSFILGSIGGIALAIAGTKMGGLGVGAMKTIHNLPRVEVSMARSFNQMRTAQNLVPGAAVAAATGAATVVKNNRREGDEGEQAESVAQAVADSIAQRWKAVMTPSKEAVSSSDILTHLVLGAKYESRCADGNWWEIRVQGENGDGSYYGVVDNANATVWSQVWPENCRSVKDDVSSSTPVSTKAAETAVAVDAHRHGVANDAASSVGSFGFSMKESPVVESKATVSASSAMDEIPLKDQIEAAVESVRRIAIGNKAALVDSSMADVKPQKPLKVDWTSVPQDTFDGGISWMIA